MNKQVSVSPRWYGPVPYKNGRPLPTNQWARNGRKRKWIVRWYAPDGTRPQQTFQTKNEAESAARIKIAEFESGGVQARLQPKRQTLGGFVDEMLAMRMGPNGQRLSVKTLREYKTILRRFSTFVGNDRLLERITVADGTRYVASLQVKSEFGKALSGCSVNKHKRVLVSALNVAVQQLNYLPVNPFLGRLKQDRIADQPIRYVTPHEFDSILEASTVMANPLWWEAFLTVCYTSAARLNEAVHLTWSDVDFEANTIRIIAKPERQGLAAWRPKDHDSRTIPVPENTVALLGRMHAATESGSEYVFIAPTRVEWIRHKREAGTWTEGQDALNNVNKNFQRRARNGGVTDVTLHDLRRSCITHWARRLTTPVVMRLAGHADISTTLRYYVSIGAADMNEARDVTADALQVDAKWTQNGVKATR